MMSHNNQPLISALYDHQHYQPDISPLIDPTALIYDMASTQYNHPMLDEIPPPGILPGSMQVYPTLNPSGPTQDSCTRKHRNDSRSNGLEDTSPEEESTPKRFRKTDDNSSSTSTPPEKLSGDREALGETGEGEVRVKKTKGRVKINMEYIPNKLRRYTTFSKRKSGIMKKAFELSTLTGTQVMLLVASETGHVYTFATPKLQPMITSERGKALIQTCLNSPDPMANPALSDPSQRMNMQGFEEMDLNYPVLNNADELKDIKLYSDGGMAFPALSQISGLLPSSSSHQNLNVLPSHIQMIGNPTVQVSPPASSMAYLHQHPDILTPSSLNVPPSPAHSPRSSPVHLAGQNVNNLIVSQHKSTSRTPSPHTPSPSQGMIASSPIPDGYARIPFPTPQGFNPPMMREATSPVIASSALLAPDRLFLNRNTTTTSSQQRISSSSVPQQMHLAFGQPTQNAISPYQTPTSSPPSQDLLPQNI